MSSINDRTPVQKVESPMTNLANSLGTKLTVRRKLAFSESSETPKKSYDNILYEHNKKSSLGIENNRVFKENSKNINNGPSLKHLMLQKIINSPFEKENSTMRKDMIIAKEMPSTIQSNPTFLLHNCHARGRLPLEDHDPNSQDSGSIRSVNRLIESQNVNEKKNSSLDSSFVPPTAVPDDVFTDNTESPGKLSQTSLPPDFKSLIYGNIINERPLIAKRKKKYSDVTPHKSDSILEDIKDTDNCKQKRKIINEFEYNFETSISSKRLKHNVDLSISFESQNENISITAPISKEKTTPSNNGFCKNSSTKFRKSFSTSKAEIKTALEKEDKASNLIGDFSQPFILPLLSFNHHVDLNGISPETLCHLLEGAYNDCIDSYLIIDCRFPYEYEGGHISGAVNIYTEEQLLKDYTEGKLGKKSPKNAQIMGKRNILIFHCEFSLERGPNLSRYLRNSDRKKNRMCYPYLDYPEIYLLDGGYCKFYNQYNHLCVPSNYRSMNDPAYAKDLRKFQSKAKTWSSNNDEVPHIADKKTLKRLVF